MDAVHHPPLSVRKPALLRKHFLESHGKNRHAGRVPFDEEDQRWAEWMAAGQAGDAAAYRKLLDAVFPRVVGFLRNKAGFLGTETLEEIAQETLLAMHRSRQTYDPTRSFKPWMLAIARFKLTDFLRAQFRRQESQRAYTEHVTLFPEGANPEAGSAGADVLRQALEQLAPSYREVIRLLKQEEKSIREAALILGLSEENVRVRAHRAYKMLANLLEKKVYE